MKRFFALVAIIAALFTISGCSSSSNTYSKDGYARIMFTDDTSYDIIVDVDGQEFSTKTELKEDYKTKRDLKYTPMHSIRVSLGSHKIQVTTKKGDVLYDGKIVVSNSETKNIPIK